MCGEEELAGLVQGLTEAEKGQGCCAQAQYLDSFCVLLVKGANVEGIGGVHLPSWGDQRGRVLRQKGG